MYETFSESKKAVLFGVCDGRSLGSFDEPDSEMPRSCRMRFVRLHTKWVPCWPMWVLINSQACAMKCSVLMQRHKGDYQNGLPLERARSRL